MEGGTGSPEVLLTASKRSGQTSKQVPHLMHSSCSCYARTVKSRHGRLELFDGRVPVFPSWVPHPPYREPSPHPGILKAPIRVE